MSDARFDICLPFILREEGGNDDNPRDPGGRTSRGITQKNFNEWLKKKGRASFDVWQASSEDVRAIYWEEYWLPTCPLLPAGIDLEFFDFAVNAGPRRATVTLQLVLNIPENSAEFAPQQEYVGPRTLAYLGQSDLREVITKFATQREKFYRGLPTFSTFGRGWIARTIRIEDAALKMLTKETPPVTTTPVVPAAPAVQDVIPEIISVLEKFDKIR